MACKKCGSENIVIRMHGVNYAFVCADCGAFQRWAKKDETPTEEAIENTCEYCDQEYVIPRVYDGGITAWDHVEPKYCLMCGRKL